MAGLSSPWWAPEAAELLPEAAENFVKNIPYLKALGVTTSASLFNELSRLPYSKLEYRATHESELDEVGHFD